MAAMEHHCRDCDKEWFDNSPGGVCPKCTSTNVAHYFDEDDDEPPWDDDDELGDLVDDTDT